MTEIEVAREKVISSALQVAASRIYLDASEPGPHDDAQAELYDDALDFHLAEYFRLVVVEIVSA